MKRFWVLVIALVLILNVVPLAMAYEEYKETPLDNAWDWATTLGKSGMEKDRILAENKAERLKRYADKLAKESQKDLSKAGKDLEKKFGF